MSLFKKIINVLHEEGVFDDLIAAIGGVASEAVEKVVDKPATKAPAKKTTAKASGVTLEQVQDKIRELVADDADNKTAIKAAIKKVDKTAERAGDFEDSPDKLKKLMDALTAIGAPADDDSGDDAGDDDIL